MERLIALGAGCIVGVGSCGSLQTHVSIGRVILPTSALIEEGTSGHYQGRGVSATPDPYLLEDIRQALNSEGIQPLEGRVWTTDAPFRETFEKVTRYQRSGILAVEMEASALMTVASFRNIPFASVLVVSDEIGTLSWKRGFDDSRYLDGLARAAKATVRALADSAHASKKTAGHGETR
jgi:uridine phosphorylase